MKITVLGILILIGCEAKSQQDSIRPLDKKYSLHWQATFIPQYHFNFRSPYAGANSLMASEPVRASVTATAFLAYKPFKNTYLVFNPEAAAGKGLSKTLGIAGFPNGEVYRVGDPKPQPFIARLYVEQRFPLSKRKEYIEEDANQLAETTNKDYLSLIVGKFSLTDFFDDSQLSHDPRTQFMNWSLMGSGAWDYPANTRGYTLGAVLQAVYHDWSFRTALSSVPIEANGPELQFKWSKAMGLVWEIGKEKLIEWDKKSSTTVHTGIFWNRAHMGNYQQSISNAGSGVPDITDSRLYGRDKWGGYISFENDFGWAHQFIKGSWNDGKNETWAFTEIDRSNAMGFQFDGEKWGRKTDKLGFAFVRNQLSDVHRNYLAKGGYGFLIGDGKLNYDSEKIVELYYSWNISRKIFLSPDYQFVTNPGYNKDRGPVHIVSLRLHAEF
ncbi:MAG: carbohydrate porin [Bacteroidota bacterium]